LWERSWRSRARCVSVQPPIGRRHDADKPDLGNHGHVLMTPIEQGKVVNVVGYRTKEDRRWNDDTWVRPTTTEEMLAKFDGWSEPVKNILSLVKKPDMWALFDHLPVATYHRKGKICLLGDSAHASTPHHGAGAGMAVEDAFILSKLLASIKSVGELESAFAAYDAVRRPRSQRLVSSSRKVGDVYNFEDGVIGDNMGAMREYLEHAWDWIWKEDLDRQLEKAQLSLRGHKEKVVEFRSSL
jgi:salicylate hydroxylase